MEEEQNRAKAQRLLPTLQYNVVYSDAELDAYPEEARNAYKLALKAARKQDVPIQYTDSAKRQYQNLAQEVLATTGFDPFVQYTPNELSPLSKTGRDMYSAVRRRLQEAKMTDPQNVSAGVRQAAAAANIIPSAPTPASSSTPAPAMSVPMQSEPTQVVNPESQSQKNIPPLRTVSVVPQPFDRRSTSSFVTSFTGGAPPRLGDKQSVVANYKDLSLCHQVTQDAVERAQMAMQILDKPHADAIEALLKKASVKNRNAKSAGSKPISFKRAASIALRAERWVYQAQAAAAKRMVKESKKCLHAMAGRPKRSTAEKEATYAKRVSRGQQGYSGVRPKGNSAQALKRAQQRSAYLAESAADNAELMARKATKRLNSTAPTVRM